MRMINYRIGYEYYKEACKKHYLEPVNSQHLANNLSVQQLSAYIERTAKDEN